MFSFSVLPWSSPIYNETSQISKTLKWCCTAVIDTAVMANTFLPPPKRLSSHACLFAVWLVCQEDYTNYRRDSNKTGLSPEETPLTCVDLDKGANLQKDFLSPCFTLRHFHEFLSFNKQYELRFLKMGNIKPHLQSDFAKYRRSVRQRFRNNAWMTFCVLVMLALVVLTQGHICLVLVCVHYWETERVSDSIRWDWRRRGRWVDTLHILIEVILVLRQIGHYSCEDLCSLKCCIKVWDSFEWMTGEPMV